MDNKTVNSKIRTFERLFRSLKYTGAEEQKGFCNDVRAALREQDEIHLQAGMVTEIMPGGSAARVKPGQNIILAGPIGLCGTVLMAKYFGEELGKVFPSWLLRDAAGLEAQIHQYPTKEMLENASVTAVYPVGEGGLRRTLYQLGKDTNLGYVIQARHVPVNQITIEFCEHFDLDPWSLLSCGSTLLACERSAGLLQEFERMKVPASVIGTMAGNKDKVITYGDTRSLVNRPAPDELMILLRRSQGIIK